jgi:hypothetical protein
MSLQDHAFFVQETKALLFTWKLTALLKKYILLLLLLLLIFREFRKHYLERRIKNVVIQANNTFNLSQNFKQFLQEIAWNYN